MLRNPDFSNANSGAYPLSPTRARRATFLLSIVGLALVPIIPELGLWLRGYTGFRAFAGIAYYEAIVSFVLWSPALILPRPLSRGYVIALGVLTAASTMTLAFEAIVAGARWDITAQTALVETNVAEAWGFARTFASIPALAMMIAIASAFLGCVIVNTRAVAPIRREAVAIITAGLLFSAYGVRNAFLYVGNPVHLARIRSDQTIPLLEFGSDGYHPLMQIVVAEWNVLSTRVERREARLRATAAGAELRGATVVPGATPPGAILFVIGESASRRHWSLYGYGRQTNPGLAQLGRELLVFRDTISRTVGTVAEIRRMLETSDALPIVRLFSANGYKTAWFTTQSDQGADDLDIGTIARACDHHAFLTGAFDANLVPLVRREIAQPGRHFIVVHLTGSHIRYDDRYPRRFAVFQDDGEKGRRVAAYDNSILYTDSVLSALIAALRESPEPSCFVYASDHSEDVYDSAPSEYRFRSDAVATDAMYEIPFVMWFSPAYQRLNPDTVAAAVANRAKPFQTVGLYNTLVDLARMRHEACDPHRSIVSPTFTVEPRVVGAMARPYHPARSVAHVLPSTDSPATADHEGQ